MDEQVRFPYTAMPFDALTDNLGRGTYKS